MLNGGPLRRAAARRSRGVTMLEVLIAIVILTIGLLGVAGMQAQMQNAEVEAYQRAQAIVLLQDMVDRINSNRRNAANYVTVEPLGTDSVIDCTAPANVAARDQCAWDAALRGAAETAGGVQLGAMNGARGCISNPVAVMPRQVVIAVAWQGVSPTVVPGGTDCGKDEFGADDRFRRAMLATIVIGCLQNNPATGVCVTP